MNMLTESGMADALAANMASLIPEALGSHIPLIFANAGAGIVSLININI